MKMLNIDRTKHLSYNDAKIEIDIGLDPRYGIHCYSVSLDTDKICINDCLNCRFAKKILKMKAKLNEKFKY